jgi:hypothetical protein
MALTPDEWLAAYREAWIERDPAAAAALFTDDATYQEQPYEEAIAGSAGVRDYWATTTATQRDVDLRYGTPLVVGSRVAVEWWVTLANGGAEITLAGSFMLKFDDTGLCSELREYWHVAEGRRRPPSGWGD